MTAQPDTASTPTQLEEEAEHVGSRRSSLWLGVVGLGALVVSLSQSLLIPVLPALPQQLHSSPETVQWLLTSTLLVGAIAVPFMGRLGDMFGKRLMLLVAIGAMLVGSLITALSSDIVVLIIGRAIQGISAAAIPLGISLLATLLPARRRATAMATISAMLGVGGALGLPFAGLIAEGGDFHTLFWVTAVAAAVAFLGIMLLVPEPKDRAGGHIDFVGAALLAGALVTLLLPLAQGSDWGWGSPRTIVLFVATVVLFAAFGLWETRHREPLVDLASLTRRPILLTNIASLFIGFALFASLIGTATYVQAPESSGYGFGTTTLVAGLTMLPSGLAMLVLSPVAARLINGIGAGQTLAIGGFIVAVGWILRITVTGSLWEIVVGSTVVGIGTGIGYAAIPALVAANTPSHELASANGVNTLIRSLGSFLASAIGGTILATVTIAGTQLPSLGGYQILFAVCAVAAIVAAVIALLTTRPSSGRSEV
ncbi:MULTISPECIES: MFS transporter [unclassified Frondihabitans]|uniref:MFS transporter n=1 Tax=unclassified Frondihabitans TaxID=2626248 RepID=UPI000F50FC72|nr:MULTISPECIES: MFS transporter [unclassified Frondihabitans]RPE77851.1 sugar transport protein [Frondihabitans sp. PhB153]RPF08130.1 sugar transport protein [Frondihabitans sp. PhB161]